MKKLLYVSIALYFWSSTVFCESARQITEFSFILKPSPISGIGIFAAHTIPAGTKIIFFPESYVHRVLPKKDIPEEFLKYCVAETDEHWIVPQRFDRMEIAWYLNHSEKANIYWRLNYPENVNSKRFDAGHCYALRDIQKDEEILINYNDFDEPESTKEEYYKSKEMQDIN